MIKKLAFLALLATAMTGCEEKIDLDERFIPVPDSEEPVRTVLIEEYTGVFCVNCPNGHDALKKIETFYNTEYNVAHGIGVIAVGIHIPVFGDPVADGGFVTPEAETLAPNQNSAPAARINRLTNVVTPEQWPKEVEKQIVRTPSIKFDLVEAEISNGILNVKGSIYADVALNDANLNVWVVEDNIVAGQLMPDGSYDANYVHHAVYRGSLTGASGSAFDIVRNDHTPFAAGNYPLPADWNVSNLRVVVFVDTPSAGVLNAAETHVTINE